MNKNLLLARCLVVFFALLSLLCFSENSFYVALYDEYAIHSSNPFTLWQWGLCLGGLIVSLLLSSSLSKNSK